MTCEKADENDKAPEDDDDAEEGEDEDGGAAGNALPERSESVCAHPREDDRSTPITRRCWCTMSPAPPCPRSTGRPQPAPPELGQGGGPADRGAHRGQVPHNQQPRGTPPSAPLPIAIRNRWRPDRSGALTSTRQIRTSLRVQACLFVLLIRGVGCGVVV